MGFFPDRALLLQACLLRGFGCWQPSGWSVRCVTNRNAGDLLLWLLKAELNKAVLSLLMLFNGLNPVVDSTSKVPCGEQGSRLEEHLLCWTSCRGSRLVLYLAVIHSGVTVDSGSPFLYSKHASSSTLAREEVCHVSQLWDKEERVLLWRSGTVPQPRRLSCCVS